MKVRHKTRRSAASILGRGAAATTTRSAPAFSQHKIKIRMLIISVHPQLSLLRAHHQLNIRS
jgi:hypothetical protein